MKLKFLSKIAGLLIFGLSIYYLGDVLFDQARVLAERSYGASDILLIGVTSVIYGIILSLLSASWSTMIIKRPEDSFQGQNFRLLNAVYMKSAILKYLPSNVLHFAGRNLFARNMGYSQLKLGAATLFEILFQIFSAILLFSAVFSLLTGPLPQLYFQLILAAGVIALPLLFFSGSDFSISGRKTAPAAKGCSKPPQQCAFGVFDEFRLCPGYGLGCRLSGLAYLARPGNNPIGHGKFFTGLASRFFVAGRTRWHGRSGILFGAPVICRYR